MMRHADIIWQNNQAESKQFGDIYFSRLGGLDESRQIFLELNDLKNRFSVADQFAIAELGFGTGLNFLLAWKLWLEVAPKGAKLDFVSSELFPMRPEDMRHALALWPEIVPFSEELIAALPLLIEGSHRISFAEGRVNLTLLYGDALKEFGRVEMLGRGFDCWFLDGFSPQKNPQMWNDSLIELLSSLTKKDGTLATFSVAGFLRRSLQAHGWKIEKVAGFGHKRESLKASFEKENLSDLESKQTAAWFSLKNISKSASDSASKVAVVVGAGLAGCWSAYCLARQGFKVNLIEREAAVASQASGNAAALCVPYLSLKKDTRHDFYTLAFDYCRREIDFLEKSGAKIERQVQGVTHLQPKDRVASFISRFEELSVPPELAMMKNEDSLLYPFGSVLNPKLLCQFLISCFPERINLCSEKEALSLTYSDRKWQLQTCQQLSNQDLYLADIVVIANSYDALNFSQTNWLPLSKVRGEIVLIEDHNARIDRLSPVCGDSYLIPLPEDRFLIGASYNRVFLDPEPCPEIQKKLFEQSQAEFGIFSSEARIVSSRVAFRASTYDRLPYVGPVIDLEKCLLDYKDLKKGSTRQRFPQCSYLPGLYLNVGHGSRGVVSTPLCAEIISSLATGSVLPVFADLMPALLPTRWLIRELARGRGVTSGVSSESC